LKITAIALRRLAEITKDPKDATAATAAEDAVRGHEKKQAVIDNAQRESPKK